MPRTELMDYLEERERRYEAIFDRIDMRLGGIEDRLLANPPLPGSQRGLDMDLEVERPPKKARRKTDTLLKVGASYTKPITQPHSTATKQFVRKHTCVMLGIKSLKHDLVPDPPPEDELVAYNEAKFGGPSKKRGEWRLDLIGPKKSPWNQRAARLFRRTFTKCALYGKWPEEDVEKALFVHMETLRARYRQQNGERSLDDHRLQKVKAARKSRLQTV